VSNLSVVILDVVAQRTQPPFAVSTMDGCARGAASAAGNRERETPALTDMPSNP
jgi:molybdopterin biosynthesis enzyme